jgi:hypothetical protein
MAAAMIATGLIVTATLAHATVVDLTGTNTTGRINHAQFDWTAEQPTGTGSIQSFLRVQADPTEEGYNTSGGTPFDDKSGPWTHDIRVSDLEASIVTIGKFQYYTLLLDVNEPGGDKSLISMDRLEFYTSDVGGQTTTDISSLGVLRWSLDGAGDSYVLLDAARNSGSGSGDMYAYIPVTSFAGALPTDFVYMYVRFGDQVGASSAGGFEEWSVGSSNEPINISTRLNVLAGDNVAIAGFIVTGTSPKKVLVRGMGPSLASANVVGFLTDPTLELHAGSTITASNDDWRDTQEAEIQATTIPPSDDRESAIVATLNPGAYTAILAGKNSGTGIGLVEIYDLDQPAQSKVANISARGFVNTGDNVMIGGFIVGGPSAGSAKMVVRAIGPSLTALDVAGALQDPFLEIHDSSGTMIASNNDWGDTQATEIAATGLAPSDYRESAVLLTLPGGAYTTIVSGRNGTVGVGLVEAYNVP